MSPIHDRFPQTGGDPVQHLKFIALFWHFILFDEVITSLDQEFVVGGNTGVDFISVGALTHSVKSLYLSLKAKK